jgi:hypothetical protein
MQVAQLVRELGLQVHTGEPRLGREVTGGCVSDLLSYVMGSAKAGNIWITIQVHPNVVGVAALLDLAAVVVVGDQQPEEATLGKAREQGVAVLTSRESAFVVAGRMYALGVK